MAAPNFTYVPTLAVRPSEMNGLEQLPALSKDRMLPVFLLAPWASSSSLEKTVERAEKAFPNRQYILDLDRDYENDVPQTDPQRKLKELLTQEDVSRIGGILFHNFQMSDPVCNWIGSQRLVYEHRSGLRKILTVNFAYGLN